MFTSNRSGENKKLPTFNQYVKDNPPEESSTWTINKILWGDVYRTITFFTNCFRYTVKLPDKESYQKAVNSVMDAFIHFDNRHSLGHWFVTYDLDNEQVSVDALPEDKSTLFSKWTQWDWGWTCVREDQQYKCKPRKAPRKSESPEEKSDPTA